MQTRLVTFADAHGARAGALLDDGRVLDLAAASEGRQGGHADSMQALIESGPAALSAVRALLRDPPADAVLPAEAVRLLAPIPRPRRNALCVGRNYLDHVAEGDRTRGITTTEAPRYPQFFTKAPECVVGPDAPVPAHAGVTEWLDYEVELAVVIGTAGSDIPRAAALDHVFGYTIANDVTARELQRRHGQWFKGKSLDGSLPLGPWIVPRDELDATDLAIECRIDGELRQSSRTSKLIFDLPEILHQLSAGFTLLPGDIVLTGTPEGVGYAMQPPRTLRAGNVMECTIEGIGTLRNRVE